MVSSGTPSTDRATKMFNPNGGVNMPIAIFTVMTIPKWIGSMPRALTSGMNSGVSTMIAEVGSRKHPTIKRITFTAIRKPHGGRLRPVSPSVMACGTPLMVKTGEQRGSRDDDQDLGGNDGRLGGGIQHVFPAHLAI